MKRPSFREAKSLVTLGIYDEIRESDHPLEIVPGEYNPAKIHGVSGAVSIIVLETLSDQGFLIKVIFNNRVTSYEVGSSFFGLVEEQLESPESELSQTRIKYAEVNKETDGGEKLDYGEGWRPLTIERDATEYTQAVDSLETAISDIAGHNEYADEEPEERDTIIISLRTGLDLVRNNYPTREQVHALIVRPLRYLSNRFASTIIGEAAKKAADHVLAWLSTLL